MPKTNAVARHLTTTIDSAGQSERKLRLHTLVRQCALQNMDLANIANCAFLWLKTYSLCPQDKSSHWAGDIASQAEISEIDSATAAILADDDFLMEEEQIMEGKQLEEDADGVTDLTAYAYVPAHNVPACGPTIRHPDRSETSSYNSALGSAKDFTVSSFFDVLDEPSSHGKPVVGRSAIQPPQSQQQRFSSWGLQDHTSAAERSIGFEVQPFRGSFDSHNFFNGGLQFAPDNSAIGEPDEAEMLYDDLFSEF